MPDFWRHLQSLCPHSDTKLLRCIAFGELPFPRNSLVIATPAGLLFCSPCRYRTDVGYVPSPVRTGIWAEVGTWLLCYKCCKENRMLGTCSSLLGREGCVVGWAWNGPLDGKEKARPGCQARHEEKNIQLSAKVLIKYLPYSSVYRFCREYKINPKMALF